MGNTGAGLRWLPDARPEVPFEIGKPQLRPPWCDTRVTPEEFLARCAQETEQRRALFSAETGAKDTLVWYQGLFDEQLKLQRGLEAGSTILPSLYALPFYDFDLRASHARTPLPAALASVPLRFVLVRVRVVSYGNIVAIRWNPLC